MNIKREVFPPSYDINSLEILAKWNLDPESDLASGATPDLDPESDFASSTTPNLDSESDPISGEILAKKPVPINRAQLKENR